MTIDFDRLRNWSFEERRHQVTERDTILYALGVGLGVPSDDVRQLPFLFEEGLRALPTMAAALGYRGFWLKDPATGVDWKRVLHGEHAIRLHGELPVSGVVVSRQHVSALIDRGEGKGAVLTLTREISREDGTPLATIEHLSLLRGDGGFGRSFGAAEPPPPLPSRAADQLVDLPMLERSALIYRLLGDYNPLHIDPTVSAAAGFPRPIVHGLCTYGLVGHAILRGALDYREERMRALRGRFTAPVFPGEMIRIELWQEKAGIGVRATAVERAAVVFDRGWAEVVDARMGKEPESMSAGLGVKVAAQGG